MKKTLSVLASALALTAVPAVSHAVDVSFNIGGVTDYRYRGISQTRLKPALQGGIDVALPLGFYVGTWASTIKWIKDIDPVGSGDSELEVDLYAGYKGEIRKDFTYDVGFLRYWYPREHLSPSANTNEIYGALTYGPATVKYSHAISTLFAIPDSKRSGYLDVSATFDVAGFGITPHIGYQKVKGINGGPATYTDYSITGSKEYFGVLFSLALVGTDADKAFYVSPPATGSKELGKTTVVFGVKKTF